MAVITKRARRQTAQRPRRPRHHHRHRRSPQARRARHRPRARTLVRHHACPRAHRPGRRRRTPRPRAARNDPGATPVPAPKTARKRSTCSSWTSNPRPQDASQKGPERSIAHFGRILAGPSVTRRMFCGQPSSARTSARAWRRGVGKGWRMRSPLCPTNCAWQRSSISTMSKLRVVGGAVMAGPRPRSGSAGRRSSRVRCRGRRRRR